MPILLDHSADMILSIGREEQGRIIIQFAIATSPLPPPQSVKRRWLEMGRLQTVSFGAKPSKILPLRKVPFLYWGGGLWCALNVFQPLERWIALEGMAQRWGGLTIVFVDGV